MSHALATVLHRGRKAASNVMAACLASSREARWEPEKHGEVCLPGLVARSTSVSIPNANPG